MSCPVVPLRTPLPFALHTSSYPSEDPDSAPPRRQTTEFIFSSPSSTPSAPAIDYSDCTTTTTSSSSALRSRRPTLPRRTGSDARSRPRRRPARSSSSGGSREFGTTGPLPPPLDHVPSRRIDTLSHEPFPQIGITESYDISTQYRRIGQMILGTVSDTLQIRHHEITVGRSPRPFRKTQQSFVEDVLVPISGIVGKFDELTGGQGRFDAESTFPGLFPGGRFLLDDTHG
mmetsp:Transcript_52194/g.156653  ORF Transcript_52194/g.156653 Transcript_52194/m.156653 type:complete len:230 (+) Transcript_52194:855-1544(+)